MILSEICYSDNEELSCALERMRADRWEVPLPRGRIMTLGGDTKIMGILNVTPDSFHAPSRAGSAAECVVRAGEMLADGASVLDIGAESTRPGSVTVPADEEMGRLREPLKALRDAYPEAVISVDTTKAEVADMALSMGADMINDISGLGDDAMARVVAGYGAALVIMHIKGTPSSMQENPTYGELLPEISMFLHERMEAAAHGGVAAESIILDPGIGFGKTAEHNLHILGHLEFLRPLGRPVLIGASRKGTIGRVLGDYGTSGRLQGTAAITAVCAANGISMVRVHDVRENWQAARMGSAICRGLV